MKAPETNIAISGHAQHGKSTLAGRILYEMHAIDEDDLNRRWQKAVITIPDFEKHKKDFNRFNIIFLDRRQPTFSKVSGQPDDPSRTAFPVHGNVVVSNHQITIIDQPGFSRFLGNIVYGLYQADLVILVVDAKKGVESGARRTAQLAAYFNVPVIAICVTKMDEVGFSESVFREVEGQVIKEVVKPFLGSTPHIIPIHALSNHPLSSGVEELSWYKGVNLFELLRTAQEKHAPAKVENLRCAVREVYAPPGIGTVMVGVLETGSLSVGEPLVLEPASERKGPPIVVRPRSIQVARGVTDPKRPGTEKLSARVIAAIATNDLNREEAEEILKHGGVLGRSSDPPGVSRKIEAELVFFRADTVYGGSEFKVRANACDGEARILSIQSKAPLPHDLQQEEYDASIGEAVRAHIHFFRRPMCIESKQIFQRLTRFVLLKDNEVVACGRCIRSIESR